MTPLPAERRNGGARDHYVYRLFDAKGHHLYVGCSMRPDRRIRAHSDRDWYREIAKIRLQGPFTYRTARAREREAESPLHNASGPVQSLVLRRYHVEKRRHRELIDQGMEYWAAFEIAHAYANSQVVAR